MSMLIRIRSAGLVNLTFNVALVQNVVHMGTN